MPYKNLLEQKEHAKKYYLLHRDKIITQAENRYYANPEKKRSYQRKYRHLNLEKIQKFKRKEYANNQEKHKEGSRKYYSANKEVMLLKSAQWKKENKDKLKEYRKKDKHINLVRYKTRREFPLFQCLKCEACDSGATEHHHVRYSLPLERKDIQMVCVPCHNKFQNNARRNDGLQLGS